MPTGNVTVTPNVPDGSAVTVSAALTFTTANWNMAQPVTVEGMNDNDYDDATVTITHTVTGYPGAAALPNVIATVNDNQGAPFFTTTVPDQTYTVGMSVALTLPEATGGEGGRLYHRHSSTDVPPGLNFDANERTLTGTPTTAAAAVTFRYEVTDRDGVLEDINDQTFTITILAAPGVILTPTTLTVEEGGTATYTVSLATEPTSPFDPVEGETVPAMVTVTPTASAPVTVSGELIFFNSDIPDTRQWNVDQTITVTVAATIDDAGATVTITHMVDGYGSVTPPELIVVLPPPPRTPSFGSMTVDEQTYVAGTAIPTLTLPEATSGNEPLTYALTGIPDGLTFTASTRTLSGTPTTAAPTVTLTYTVTDSDDDTADSDTATLAFDVTVEGVVIDPTALTVEEGSTNVYSYTVVLATNPGGDVTVTPTITNTDKLIFRGNPTLSFSAANWSTAQTVTVSGTVDYDADNETVIIDHAVVGYGSVTAGSVTVTVRDVNNAPGFNIPVANQIYAAGAAITPLTLPEATAGNAPLTYALTGSIPAGLTFDATARTLTGTPTTPAQAVTLTYMVVDSDTDTGDDDSDSLTFTVTIGAMAGVIIDPSALTVEEGSTTVHTYTVVLTTMPTGAVTVTPDTGGSGGLAPLSALTFAAAAWNMHQTVTVSAPADPAATASRAIVINHGVSGYGDASVAPGVTVTITLRHRVPSFGSQAVPAQPYTVNVAIPTLTLPEATGGNGSLRYTLTGSIPPGLTFNDNTRTMTGTPTTVDTTGVTLTYTVADADDNVETADTAVLTFAVTINRVPAVTISPSALTVEEGSTVDGYTVVLTTNPGGDVTVTPAIGDGTKLAITGAPALTFNAANWSTAQTVTVSGTVDYDAADETVTITHRVVGYEGVTAGSVTVTVTDVNNAPVFDMTTVAPQTYIQGMIIPTLTLPEATGGNGALTYALAVALPDGLTFDPNARTLSGTPTTVAPAVTLTYTATDEDADTSSGDTATLPVPVTIVLASAITVTPTALTVDEGGTNTYTVVLITRPDNQVIVTPAPDMRVTISGAHLRSRDVEC